MVALVHYKLRLIDLLTLSWFLSSDTEAWEYKLSSPDLGENLHNINERNFEIMWFFFFGLFGWFAFLIGDYDTVDTDTPDWHHRTSCDDSWLMQRLMTPCDRSWRPSSSSVLCLHKRKYLSAVMQTFVIIKATFCVVQYVRAFKSCHSRRII